ncbi:MAG: TerB family tellurite resistance protein, partial [Candidatus Limnocylindrales bacterium]
MFRRIFGSDHEVAADRAEAALNSGSETTGDTATVRRIVARLEAMPPEQARLAASTAYTLARAANADLDISPVEAAQIERHLQANGLLDEASAVLVTEMAKLQARTVGGTEDYVVTREFRDLATEAQRLDVLRACFAVAA